jgi:hypothetical protein
MKIFFKSLAGILSFIIVISVALYALRNVNRQPSLILTSDICDAPCWYGITPGLTDSWSTYEMLSQITGVDLDSMQTGTVGGGAISYESWNFQLPVEDSMVTFYFENDIVNAITVLTVDSLTLEDFFEKFGEPDQYWTKIGHGDYSDYLDVLLFYPEEGYLVEMVIDFTVDATQVEIKEKTPILGVTFFDPAQYNELLTTNILINQPVKAREGTFIPWTGYGAIEIHNQQ